MNIRDIYTSKSVAIVDEKVASNEIPYLGEGFFPTERKAGLDLKDVRTADGLPVSLMPSAFDTVSTIRSREGFELQETEMAFFKESMLLKEKDRQEIMRVQDSTDPYAQDVLKKIFNDAETLVKGAKVVPERMRMSLLANENGHPSISISADGATYEYNYDPNNKYSANNFVNVGAVQATNYWTDTVNSDPISDIESLLDKAEDNGVKIDYILMSKNTLTLMRKNKNVHDYILAQNKTATIKVTNDLVKSIVSELLGVNIVVYSKKYKDEAGNTKKFYPDGMVTLIPSGALGRTYFGTTPDEADLLNKADIDCTIRNGVAITVTTSTDPVQTKTTVSEIVLPSFPRMYETFMMKVEATVAY